MQRVGSRELAIGLGLTGRRMAWSLNSRVGAACLVLAVALTIALPPSPVTIALAAVAALGLAAERSLGPVGAGLLVALAIPWGRGADTLTWEIAGIPIRPHDAVLAVAIVGAALRLPWSRPRTTPMLVLVAGFLALGVVAGVIGLVADNALRDILRDARWWGLYALGFLVLLGAARRDQVVRGLLLGTTAFSLGIVAATILPAFVGGLKSQELIYDRGLLRMQFGNSAFLLPAMAFVGARILRRPRLVDAAWLALLVVAVALSLTRTSMLASLGVLALVVVIGGWDRLRAGHFRLGSFARATGVLAGVTALALVGGIALNIVGTPGLAGEVTGGVAVPGGGGGGGAVIGRVVFSDETSSVDSIQGGRFTSYRRAVERIARSPIIGLGLGALTPVDFAYDQTRAHTIGQAAGVDDAYLTVGLKGGLIAIAVFGAMVALALWLTFRGPNRRRAWLLPALAGIAVLTVTQSFATSLYGPAIVGVLLVLPALAGAHGAGRARGSVSPARPA